MKDTYRQKQSDSKSLFAKHTLISLLISTAIISVLILITAAVLIKLKDPVSLIPVLSYCILYLSAVTVGFLFTEVCKSFPLPSVIGGAYIMLITFVLMFLTGTSGNFLFKSLCLRLLTVLCSVMGGLLSVLKSNKKEHARTPRRSR